MNTRNLDPFTTWKIAIGLQVAYSGSYALARRLAALWWPGSTTTFNFPLQYVSGPVSNANLLVISGGNGQTVVFVTGPQNPVDAQWMLGYAGTSTIVARYSLFGSMFTPSLTLNPYLFGFWRSTARFVTSAGLLANLNPNVAVLPNSWGRASGWNGGQDPESILGNRTIGTLATEYSLSGLGSSMVRLSFANGLGLPPYQLGVGPSTQQNNSVVIAAHGCGCMTAMHLLAIWYNGYQQLSDRGVTAGRGNLQLNYFSDIVDKAFLFGAPPSVTEWSFHWLRRAFSLNYIDNPGDPLPSNAPASRPTPSTGSFPDYSTLFRRIGGSGLGNTDIASGWPAASSPESYEALTRQDAFRPLPSFGPPYQRMLDPGRSNPAAWVQLTVDARTAYSFVSNPFVGLPGSAALRNAAQTVASGGGGPGVAVGSVSMDVKRSSL